MSVNNYFRFLLNTVALNAIVKLVVCSNFLLRSSSAVCYSGVFDEGGAGVVRFFGVCSSDLSRWFYWPYILV